MFYVMTRKRILKSQKTVTSRVEAINKNLTSKLISKISQFKFYSITMDESTDINDTAQLLLFIRGVDENFSITEELARMRSLKGTTTGSDIFHEFLEGLSTLKVPITSICNITTDGAQSMAGKKNLDLLEYLIKNTPRTMLSFYIALYVKMPYINLL